MSDSRCVNPAYGLDVDLMILEYLMHTTIKAQIEAARHPQSVSDAENGSVDSAKALVHALRHVHRSFQAQSPGACTYGRTRLQLKTATVRRSLYAPQEPDSTVTEQYRRASSLPGGNIP